jgi:SAM-dependent methyltransferase
MDNTPRPTCPACDAYEVTVIEYWVVARGRVAMACWSCGFLFTHPRPTEEELTQRYGREGIWQSRHATAHAAAQTKSKKRSAPALLAALDEHFPATRPRAGARMFDFGCGTGAWLNAFQDRGWLTAGLEPSTDVAFVRHERLDTVPADGRFELVFVWHVLEHLPRPVHVLQTLARAIAPGGYCLVSVPRVDTIAIHRDLSYILRPPAHISAYTEACLRGLMASCGLHPVAALHELDDVFSRGAPVRLRLLARKGSEGAMDAGGSQALHSVLNAVKDLTDPSAAPAGV